ncbi:MAG TPA: F0F1 ATP synthase subunit alpha [Dictyoglomaceae bacterium]|nr:F0F1 ATP synthase subunit alpha [Dictyoglomaceae bacterium]HOL39289.1 F0F1 ATP synthase subunit alpha [Dictyoglomaceae bacterium]HPP15852.1 F0F1 ATP synthase subunit alpha [Dictyoglomaceae bacterium]
MKPKEAILGIPIDALSKKIREYNFSPRISNIGYVRQVGDGVAQVSLLNTAFAGEIVVFESGIEGMVLNLEEDSVGVILLGKDKYVKEGDVVYSTGKILQVPTGNGFLGRVIDPLGNPLDEGGIIFPEAYLPVDREAPSIFDREPVKEPLYTGIRTIDALIPIGHGQRELILGDRQTGKTTISIDTIINQKNYGTICIYVAIAQKRTNIARIVQTLKENNAISHTIVIATFPDEPPALRYIAPMAGCAMGEYFMEQGEKVLVVYDDLTKHANTYREISLLLRRVPGREAYPGDIFYLHSHLLERAAKLNAKKGGGALTALPIAETLAGEIATYIPTNLISITDGQIYLDTELFNSGTRPAINVGLSVSRVGGSAQPKGMRQVAGRLRLDLAQYREYAMFLEFGTELDMTTKKKIDRGERIEEILKQGAHDVQPIEEQIITFYLANGGFLDNYSVEEVKNVITSFIDFLKQRSSTSLALLRQQLELTDQIIYEIHNAFQEFQKTYANPSTASS